MPLRLREGKGKPGVSRRVCSYQKPFENFGTHSHRGAFAVEVVDCEFECAVYLCSYIIVKLPLKGVGSFLDHALEPVLSLALVHC